MPDHFEFEQEQRDGLQLIRWLGDPEISGWRRDDLWGPGRPRFVGEYRMFGWAGLLYAELLGLVWRLTVGLGRFALPQFDGVGDCDRLGRPMNSSDGSTASSGSSPTGPPAIAGSWPPNRTERSQARGS